MSSTAREYKFYDNVEIKDGVAILRINCPGKMNTINPGFHEDTEKIFKEKINGNSNVKAVVFISSKPDNFIAGADIDLIKNTPNKNDLAKFALDVHSKMDELKKVLHFDHIMYIFFVRRRINR
jgi:enoyl-CoA hydratase/carnithine racemase